MKILILISTIAFLSGCATTSTEKVYQNMILAGTAGAIYGATKPEYKTTQSVMYGAVGAAVAAAVTLYFEGPDKEEIKLRQEVQSLKARLDQFTEPKVISQGPATFGARIPEKYRAMVNPGEWKVYSMDEWVDDGENRIVHQDKAMELIPPSLIPGK
ncbi:hypothetical protein [Bdellovibrio sp. NC01]|uniref:hypothetical protein n=1 Tax=Bdellovibrio sp. NC01 TaxID=2220073 RepID=UPI00115C200F|nr:hypothetical protein [Bdellovibrio sp. NC01]QDK37923.1 hypothetical protein DOE51_10170 [Bdellovibrio sp. NC01]